MIVSKARVVLLFVVSFFMLLIMFTENKKNINNEFNNEINIAKESRIINELLFKYKSESEASDFFFRYFQPIAKIDKFKSIQFVFANDGNIMHIQKSVDSNRLPFDFRLRDWYKCAESVNVDKGHCLSLAYFDYWYPHQKIITYSYPVYYDGVLLGVGLHDIVLEDINRGVFLVSMVNVDGNGDIIYQVNYWYMLFLMIFLFLFLLIITELFRVAIPILFSYFDVDELTKLNTRKSFKYLQASEKIKAVCLIDIDFFKKINDNFGHDIGDLYLFEVSNKLLSSIRKSDKLYRWGWEEFLLLLTNASGEDYDHRLTLERLRKNIESIAIKDINHKVTATIGFSDYSTEFDIDDMIKKADRALYVGKQSGRNQVVKYEDIV